MSTRPLVFISCGQSTEEERSLGRDLASLVTELAPGVEGYFAQNEESLESLSRNVLSAINQCIAFVAVMHPRGRVAALDGSERVRASVWVEQELAIASFLAQAQGKEIPVAVYIHRSIALEGIRQLLQLNRRFQRNSDVTGHFRSLLEDGGFLPSSSVRKPKRRSPAHKVMRLGFGQFASALNVSNFGAGATVREDTSKVGVFELDQLDDLLSFIQALPGCRDLQMRPTAEGAIFAPGEFTAAEFGTNPNGIHVRANGDVALRFSPIGAHVLYDIDRTLGCLYALGTYMYKRHGACSTSSVEFGYRLLAELYPRGLVPTPTYQGWAEMDVASENFEEAFTEPLVECLRSGERPEQSIREVRASLADFSKNTLNPLLARI